MDPTPNTPYYSGARASLATIGFTTKKERIHPNYSTEVCFQCSGSTSTTAYQAPYYQPDVQFHKKQSEKIQRGPLKTNLYLLKPTPRVGLLRLHSPFPPGHDPKIICKFFMVHNLKQFLEPQTIKNDHQKNLNNKRTIAAKERKQRNRNDMVMETQRKLSKNVMQRTMKKPKQAPIWHVIIDQQLLFSSEVIRLKTNQIRMS
jgi:hypothetical protein